MAALKTLTFLAFYQFAEAADLIKLFGRLVIYDHS
jgi:hypothetical protein